MKEEVTVYYPTPDIKHVEVNEWVYEDRAGDILTQRIQTGVLLFLSLPPIAWYAKQLATIESSSFGSEVVAMKNLP